MNGLSLGYIIGCGLSLFSISVIAPLIIAYTQNEPQAFAAFLVTGVFTIFTGGGLMIALQGKLQELSRREKIFLVIFAWIVYSALASIPFEATGVLKDRVNAIFEATSAVTTTGATLFDELTQLPKSIIFWRAQMQWLGGLLTLFTLCFAFIPFFNTESFKHDLEKSSSNLGTDQVHFKTTLRIILPVYFGLTLTCFAGLILTQIPIFDAICLALSTVSTGGFMPRNGAFSTYGSTPAMFVITIFMILGGISILWIHALFQREIKTVKTAKEPIWIILSILALTLIFIILKLQFNAGKEFLGIGRETVTALMDAASLITTSGFIATPHSFERLSPSLVLTIIIIGGGILSTAGGLKFTRVVVMLDQSRKELRSLIYPNEVSPNVATDVPVESEYMTTIWVIFTLTITVAAITTLILSYNGLALEPALYAAFSALSNCGPCYEQLRVTTIDNGQAFIDLATPSKIALIAAMIIGRLEIIVAVCLLNITFWRH